MPKGSRFWTFTPPVILLSALMAWHFDDPGVFTGITLIWMGGASMKSTVESHHKGNNGG